MKTLQVLRGVPVSRVAERARIPADRLRKQINGQHMLRADEGVRLAAALGVPAEWLFDDARGMDDLAGTGATQQAAVETLRIIAHALGQRADDLDRRARIV